MDFGGRCDRQRTLVIRIAAITLVSDSAITIARFRPSDLCTKMGERQSIAQKGVRAIDARNSQL